MHTVADCKKVVDLNNNSDDLGKAESVVTLEEEEQELVFNVEEGNNLGEVELAASEEQEPLANFNVPLSIFHYKGYDSDFFISWYNVSSEIFKEINGACPEKKVLNLALSVLMFPYIVFTALGLVIYNKINSKTQANIGEDKTKKSETSVPERLAYGVLAAIVILVNIAMLAALLIPATLALATFYLLNRKLSHSLVAVLKVSSGSYQKKHQDIEVSFREIDAGKLDIKWDMEVKFPPQFKQLLRDLYEDKDGSWFNVARDSERNPILKLSANIHLKNGLKPLRNEIKNVLATSTREFAKTMEELMKLEKKEITYDKLKELLNEFRLKVVSSIGPKLTTHLIYNAYQIAFIQAIKFAQERREDFSLESALRDILVKQELESQGKELPSEKEIIIEDLKNAGMEVEDSKDDEFPVHEAEWKEFIKEGKIVKRTVIDIYKNKHSRATEKALGNAKEEIEHLRGIGQIRYNNIYKELKEIHENSSLNGTLKRGLEDLFKFEYDDQEVERRLIKSVMKKAQGELSQLDIPDKEKQNLRKQLEDLEKKVKVPSDKEASAKINDFIEKMYLEIKKYKVQKLLREQKKGVLRLCKKLRKYDESDLAEIIEAFRVQDEGHLEEFTLEKTLKDQNERLQAKQNDREKGHPITKSIEVLLKRNEAILKALKQLELGKKELLINEETKNDYKEELTSREKIKFTVIEDDLLKVFKLETFDEKEIKKLLERAELEYCLAERCIKYPVIKTKDNIKHFSQNLLSPLIDNLVENIINNVSKDNDRLFTKFKKLLGVGWGWFQLGAAPFVSSVPLVRRIYDQNLDEALKTGQNTHKEVETFLQYFELSYEKAGAFLGDLFSDEGETFQDDIWPKIEEHLHGMWDRFFKDIEFKIGNRLDEVSVTQQQKNSRTL